MEAKMEKIDVNVVKFEVKVEAEKFAEALTRAYKKNIKKFNPKPLFLFNIYRN